MVSTLLLELRLLPSSHWKSHVATFNRRLDKLAETVISYVHHSDSGSGGSLKEELKRLLCIDERELTIVAARAERRRPGVFLLIFQSS
jgi:hypothetical protein